ncbi:MAG TPA: four-helix bundle copper-binding protein [Flavobacteriales bacterium]|nr:four-helix bundle copper-binding protein [Flavobacteriales bacterium]
MKDPRHDDLIQRLNECIAACEHCADACLDETDPARMARCMRLDRDCADLCTLVLRFLARGSEHVNGLLVQCVMVCRACEQECAQHKNAHCQACARACLACHTACEEAIDAAA